MRVHDIMTREVISCRMDTDVGTAARSMFQGRFGTLPVVDTRGKVTRTHVMKIQRSRVMASSGTSALPVAPIAIALVAVMLSASVATQAAQRATAPRLRESSVPAQIPGALGGGEVVLELTVDSRGGVGRIERLRATPPYTDLVADSAAAWQFDPATSMIEGRPTTVAAPVLVVAVFRPASLYGGPAPGVPPETLGVTSPRLPNLVSAAMPAYPPTATGSAIVLVEIEMSGRADPRGYRIVGPVSGFDTAALDAVRAWRFDAPRAPEATDRVFVYAVLGFRAPLAPVTPPRE